MDWVTREMTRQLPVVLCIRLDAVTSMKSGLWGFSLVCCRGPVGSYMRAM